MKYTRENYEEYALDYLEGTMTAGAREAFEAFLGQHPDIKAEFDEFEWVSLTPPDIQHPDKTTLYRRPGQGLIYFLSHNMLKIAAAIVLLLSLTFVMINRSGLPASAPDMVEQQYEPPTTPPLPKSETPLLSEKDMLVKANPEPEPQDDLLPVVPSEEAVAVTPATKSKPKEIEPQSPVVTKLQPISAPSEVAFAESTEALPEVITPEAAFAYEIAALETLPTITPVEFHLKRSITEVAPVQAVIEVSKEAQSGFKIGKFLADAHLIPKDLDRFVKEDLKEKFIPESIYTR
jgi:hypothetical protein